MVCNDSQSYENHERVYQLSKGILLSTLGYKMNILEYVELKEKHSFYAKSKFYIPSFYLLLLRSNFHIFLLINHLVYLMAFKVK